MQFLCVVVELVPGPSLTRSASKDNALQRLACCTSPSIIQAICQKTGREEVRSRLGRLYESGREGGDATAR